MTEQQVTRAATIVTDETLNFLAKHHETTVSEVVAGLQAGHEKLIGQFAKLIAAGMNEAAALMSPAT